MRMTTATPWALLYNTDDQSYLPVYPGAQLHRCSLMLCSQHVPLFLHGLESHAFDMGISQRDAVNPNGHWHEKPGWEWGDSWVTAHVPPFWHRGTGPVWQGFFHWQYGPTNSPVQLKHKKKKNGKTLKKQCKKKNRMEVIEV